MCATVTVSGKTTHPADYKNNAVRQNTDLNEYLACVEGLKATLTVSKGVPVVALKWPESQVQTG